MFLSQWNKNKRKTWYPSYTKTPKHPIARYYFVFICLYWLKKELVQTQCFDEISINFDLTIATARASRSIVRLAFETVAPNTNGEITLSTFCIDICIRAQQKQSEQQQKRIYFLK